MFPDLSVPIRSAIVDDSGITALLPTYLNSYPVFTRQPVPDDVPSLTIVISPDAQSAHEDGIADQRIAITRDIVVSGRNPDEWRDVSRIAEMISALFHRRPQALSVDDWKVFDIRVSSRGGQMTDLDQNMSMVLSVTVRLAHLP